MYSDKRNIIYSIDAIFEEELLPNVTKDLEKKIRKDFNSLEDLKQNFDKEYLNKILEEVNKTLTDVLDNEFELFEDF